MRTVSHGRNEVVGKATLVFAEAFMGKGSFTRLPERKQRAMRNCMRKAIVSVIESLDHAHTSDGKPIHVPATLPNPEAARVVSGVCGWLGIPTAAIAGREPSIKASIARMLIAYICREKFGMGGPGIAHAMGGLCVKRTNGIASTMQRRVRNFHPIDIRHQRALPRNIPTYADLVTAVLIDIGRDKS